jgi:hypothetical protein
MVRAEHGPRQARPPLDADVRPLWTGTFMPQRSSMECGRVEHVDTVADATVKGNVYGTI